MISENENLVVDDSTVIVEPFQNNTILMNEIIIDGDTEIEDVSLIIKIVSPNEEETKSKKSKKSG